MAVTPRPVTTAPDSDPRAASRPATVAGGKAHWDALTIEALATGGLTAAQVATGYDPTLDPHRAAESLPNNGVPLNLRSTAVTATTADLAWNAVFDAVSYRLRRNGVDVAGATALTALTFHDTGLTTATTYSYTVSSIDASGVRSAESGAVSVKTA